MRKFAFSVPLTALLLAPAVARVGVPAAVALLLAPARAIASCAYPHAFVAPANGARLPPSPTLYVFAPLLTVTDPGREPAIKASAPNGAPLSHRLSPISKLGDFRVYRLDIDSGSAPRVDVKVSFGSGTAAEPIAGKYTIDKAWAQPDRSALEIVGAEEHVSRWTCSYTSTQTLTPEGGALREAPAYRVAWASADGAASGTLVLPSSTSQFFNGGVWPDPRWPTKADLSLGHASCFGNTFPWGKEPVDVRVTALFADGSESAPPERAFRVRPPRNPIEPAAPAEPATLVELMGPLAEPAPAAGPAASPPPPRPFAIDPKLTALAALGSFVTAAVAAFFVRGRRRR